MAATAKLFTTVSIEWSDFRGRDCGCDVEVDYTFDGEDLRIIKTKFIGSVDTGYDGDMLDELVWEAVNDEADESYGEWLADLGDWQYEQARDRAAESYLPNGGAA